MVEQPPCSLILFVILSLSLSMDSLYSTTASAIDEPKSLWGPLTIALLASMTQAFGISLQRRAHLVEQQLGIDGRLPFYKRPLWLSGFLIYTLSNIVQSSCTIGYLPIVILAPVGAIGLVFNAVFAKLVLGDPFTLKTVLGMSYMYVCMCVSFIYTMYIISMQVPC